MFDRANRKAFLATHSRAKETVGDRSVGSRNFNQGSIVLRDEHDPGVSDRRQQTDRTFRRAMNASSTHANRIENCRLFEILRPIGEIKETSRSEPFSSLCRIKWAPVALVFHRPFDPLVMQPL